MGRSLVSDNFAELWRDALEVVMFQGNVSSPRGQMVRELLGLQLTLENALNNIVVRPEMNHRFMIAEWLWIMAGRDDVATIDRYNKRYKEFAADPGSDRYAGAYGPRLMKQWRYLIDCLKKEDSRQAVASIWTPCPEPSRDIPCTLTMQLLLRNNVLHAIVTMRSSDLWKGLVYDMFNFTMMLNAVAGEIGAGIGSLTYQLGSAHVYEPEWAKVEDVAFVHREKLEPASSPVLPGFPPSEAILGAARGYAELPKYLAADPWSTYLDVLRCTSNGVAIDYLKTLEGDDYAINKTPNVDARS